LAWVAAVEQVAAVGPVVVAALDLAVRVAAEQVRVARACGNPAGCRAAVAAEVRAAAQVGDRELVLAQALEAAEEQVGAEERVVGVV
jgi:hypothetical protein